MQVFEEKRMQTDNQELIDFIDDISIRFFPKASNRDLTPAETEAHFYNKMRNVYSEFSFRVLKCAPDFTGMEPKALKDIINFLRLSAEAQNKSRGIYNEPFQVDAQVIGFWKVMLSEQFWTSIPEFYRKQVYLRQMRPYIKNYIQIMYEQMRNSETAKELKKQKDQNDFAELLKLRGL